MIVDNDGGHSGRRAEGKVALEAVYHELHLLYFEDYMGQELEVGYSGRNVLETVLPDTKMCIRDRVTGADAYGELTRGARIIELYEDQFKFDTWISTPSGREAAYYLSLIHIW